MTTPPLTIHPAASAEEARSYVDRGYLLIPDRRENGRAMFCAPDCYFQDWGKMDISPMFVVSGEPTEDATFTIASLAGIVPKPTLPDRNIAGDIASLITGAARGAIHLIAPKGGSIILAWRHRQKLARVSGSEGALAAWWKLAVEDWAALLGKTYGDDPVAELMARDREIARARADEMDRREAAS